MSEVGLLGLVDGSRPSSSRRFGVVLFDDAVVQLDDLVTTTQTLPDGRELRHFGIVVETTGEIEGVTFASDTARVAHDRTMPGLTSRRVEVEILRSVPEVWVAPLPGAAVERSVGEARELALFADQMESPLAVGLDQAGEPVAVDLAFLDGRKGGHLNISGISGVATKTSYALFLLYQLLETESGRRQLGRHAPNTRALVFNVKGEDLLQIDRPNRRFGERPEAAGQWQALGVGEPGPFENVRLWAPRAQGARSGSAAPEVVSRTSDEVSVYGWTPWEFIRRGLLRFCFGEAEDARTQVGFVEQRVRVQLARWAYPHATIDGAVVLAPPPANCSYNLDTVARQKRQPLEPGEGTPIESFSDLVDFLTEKLETEDSDWLARVQANTAFAFLRRLYALSPRIGQLIDPRVTSVDLTAAQLSVVDLHGLHDAAQRFVVGALVDEAFASKQGAGREPLHFIVLDELNKYAPREGTSPLKELLVDIAERGRSLGVILIGAQQAASAVSPAILRNAAIKVVGRLDAGEAAEYRFLTPELRERASRFLPGTMVLDQPLVPTPIPIRFPFPAFATSVDEGRRDVEEQDREAADLFDRL